MIKTILLLPVIFLVVSLSALECFTRNGIAANFVDIQGKWCGTEQRVGITPLPEGLRFTFYTGVKNKDYNFIAKAKPDTPAVVGGESVELQIAPDVSRGIYYHIGVNPAGVLYTAKKKDTSWEPRRLKVDVKDWSKVIIDVAYADLEQKKPAAGTAWKINFCHTRSKGNYTGHFSWSGIPSFHDYQNYGTLRFGESAAPVVILEKQSAIAASARIINGQNMTLELEEDGKIWKGSVSKDGAMKFEVPGITALPIKSALRRTFRLKERSGKILWERSALSGFDNRPYLELDRCYYTPADKKLFWKSTFAGKKDFFLEGKQPLKWSSSENSGSVDLPREPGRYLVTVKWGNIRFSRVIIILPAAPLMRGCSSKWERKGPFLYCGGRRRFLVGGSQTKVLQLHHGACFNFAHIPVGVMPGALPFYGMRGKKLRRAPEGTGYLFPGDEARTLEFFRSEAVKLNSQALQITRIAYEAQMKSWFTVNGKLEEQDSARVYKKIYEEMKKYAPGQLFSLQIDRQEKAPLFAPACDVFEIAVKGSYATEPMPGIAQEIRNIRKVVPDKVLIHWFGVTVPDTWSRSAEELRAELYLAFINNSAGGLFHLGHGFLPADRSMLWSVISSTGAELDEMMEEFHRGKALPVKESAGSQIALRDCGSYWLIVGVNCRNDAQRISVELPGKKRFSALFGALEPRVFRIRK